MGMAYQRIPCPYTKNALMDVFYSKDKDNDRKLTSSELIQAFDYLGSRWSGFRAAATLLHADIDGDHCISPREIDKLIDYTFDCQYAVA